MDFRTKLKKGADYWTTKNDQAYIFSPTLRRKFDALLALKVPDPTPMQEIGGIWQIETAPQ